MKPEDQIRALAELDNVEDIPERYEHAKQCTIQDCGSGFKPYLTSLDAVVPLIVKWCGDDGSRWDSFLYSLWEMLKIDSDTEENDAWRVYFQKTTPAQLCEALLRATGKWKDDK